MTATSQSCFVAGAADAPSASTIAGPAAFLGRARIGCLVQRLFREGGASAPAVAGVLAGYPQFCARLMAAANRIHFGAGIPARNLEAAIVRFGVDRTRALIVASEAARLPLPWPPTVPQRAEFWTEALARGSFARALAMNGAPQIAGEAFLVGFLQDIGVPLTAAAEPASYADLLTRCGGSPLRLSVLEWQAFNFNHIHVALEVLPAWGLPDRIIESIGRHHTNPPLSASDSPTLRLWQIAFLAGSIPVNGDPNGHFAGPTISRMLTTAFSVGAAQFRNLLRQAADEYSDVAAIFEGLIQPDRSPCDLYTPTARLLGAAPPSPVNSDGHWQPTRGLSREDRERIIESAGPRLAPAAVDAAV